MPRNSFLESEDTCKSLVETVFSSTSGLHGQTPLHRLSPAPALPNRALGVS